LFSKNRNSFNEDNLGEIVSSCLKGKEDAQRVLFSMYFSYARSIATRYSSDDDEAREIINDSFLKVFKNLALYDFALPFRAWLRTIVVHTSIDYFRRKKKYAVLSFQDQLPETQVSETIIDQLSAEEIMVLVRRLSPAYRTVFVMYVVDGFNHREIAELLNINEGTSKSNLSKARVRLQEMILKENPALYSAFYKG
jgi:RNA polymerase sigma-70 factor (ECF subfamily)